MKENFINDGIFAGRVFSHTFEKKTSKAGKEYYSGKMYIATEGDGGVVVVDFPYIGKNNKDGEPNKTFLLVEDLIRNKKTIRESGLEKAMIVGTNHAVLSKNEYFSSKFITEDGEPTFSSLEQFRAFSFYEMKFVPEKECDRNFFKVDCFITKVDFEEGEGENPNRAVLTCVVFDEVKQGDVRVPAIIPFKFPIYKMGGINYFMSIKKGENANGLKLPLFTQLVGKVEVTTEMKEAPQEEEEDKMSAFGEETETPVAAPTAKITRELVILNAKGTPYKFGLDSTLTKEEVQNLILEREKRLEQMKAETVERINNQNRDMEAFDNNYNDSSAPSLEETEDNFIPFEL